MMIARRVGSLVGLSLMPALVATAFAFSTATSHATGPTLHRVRYEVISTKPLHAEIYYRDTDPADFASYSHNPYEFSPNVEVDIGPGRPWVLETTLADPGQWAMVVASAGRSAATPMLHCELAVDGAVVVTRDGPKGALCSVRDW